MDSHPEQTVHLRITTIVELSAVLFIVAVGSVVTGGGPFL